MPRQGKLRIFLLGFDEKVGSMTGQGGDLAVTAENTQSLLAHGFGKKKQQRENGNSNPASAGPSNVTHTHVKLACLYPDTVRR